MKRKTRTEILVKGSPLLAQKLANQILGRYPVEIVQKPHNSLVMMKVRENAQRSLFYLGELVVTECKVKIQQSFGLGIAQGHQSDLAYHLAIIDAAYRANLAEISSWEPLLEAEKNSIDQKELINQKKILQTKVNFDTMNIEI